MAGSHYAATNKLASGTVTATGTDTGFAIANVYALRTSKTWRAADTSANQRINIDHGSAATANFAALLNHNLQAGSTVIVQSYTVAPPSSGTWTSATDEATFTIRAKDMWVALTSSNVRYRSFYLQNDGGASWSANGKPKIGEVILADSVQLTRQFIVGGSFSSNQANITHVTPSGMAWMAHSTNARSWSVSYQDLSESERAELETMHTATAGAAKPFTWVPDPDSGTAATAAQVYYVRVGDSIDWTDDFNDSGLGLNLTELPVEISLT